MSEAKPPLEGDDAAICDPEILAELMDLFGKERLAHLLAGLDDEIVQRLETATPEHPSLAANAHALVSVSGVLGFSSLSQACAALEQACHDGDRLDEPLRAAQAEARRARPVIGRLRAANA